MSDFHDKVYAEFYAWAKERGWPVERLQEGFAPATEEERTAYTIRIGWVAHARAMAEQQENAK